MDEETMTAETDDETTAVSPAETDEDDDRAEKGVSSDLIRGHINTIILRSLYDGDKYGYEIIAEIERKSSGQYTLKQPSLYSALKRLEKDGYITSYWGGSVGGGRRKYFSLTDEGKAVSEQNQAEWEYSRTIIDSLISDRDFDFNMPAPTAVDMRVLRQSTSRVPSRTGDEDEGEEFSFEAGFDDTALREKIEEEAKQKQSELDAAYDEKRHALEAEYEEKLSALARDRADFEAEKASLTEEMNARERELNDSYISNLRQLAIVREQQEALLLSKKEEVEQQISEERAQFEADKAAEALAKTEEDESLKAELELQKQKFDEAAEEHARAISALKEANEQALSEEREAHDASLRVEKELHEKELSELEDKHSREIQAVKDDAQRLQDAAVRLAHEEESVARESELAAERKRFDELLSEERTRYNNALAEENSRHDAQIRDDRARYQQALEEQLAALRRQMEAEMAERERQIIHRNFISLVDSPASRPQPSYAPQPVAEEPAPRQEDYRSVIGQLYENSVRSPARTSEDMDAKPVSGIDFRDVEKRATRDGLRVETVGSETKTSAPKGHDDVNTVHKGKALFLSSLAALLWCILVGGVTMGLNMSMGDKIAVPAFYPYIMWCVGVAAALVTGLMFANHFGENRLRKPSLALVNAIVIYVLIDIVALIVALSLKIDFSDLSQLMTYVVLPAIFFVGELIFGICYFVQVKPKK